MVTKRLHLDNISIFSFILAKNHMVTKLTASMQGVSKGFILAKNHMVTKQLHVIETPL